MIVPILRPWQWAHRVPPVLAGEALALVRLLRDSWRVLWAVTWVDFQKRYAGSVLGVLWSPLYAILFLGLYSFVFLFVFPTKGRSLSSYEYILFMFTGFAPYLGLTDAIASGAASIKSNIHLLKNTIFPAELVPVKHLLVCMLSCGMSLALLLVLVAPTRFVGWHLLYLPVPVVLLLLGGLFAVWFFSVLAVLLPDVNQVINIITLLLLFLSPIGFQLADVNGAARYLLYANPLTYLIESFRFAYLGMRDTPLWLDAVAMAVGVLAASLSGALFRRLKPLVIDCE